VQKRIAAPARPVAVRAEVDARARDAGEPFATFGGGVRGGVTVVDRWTAFGQTRFEAGRAERDVGDVDLRAFFLGAGAEYVVLRSGRLSIDAGVAIFAGWMGLRGRARGGAADAGATDSFTGEVALGAGPTLRLGPVDVGLDLEVGAMLRAPLGLVGGEPDVSPGGPWAGAGLRIGAVP
jgi:hypothetical protein